MDDEESAFIELGLGEQVQIRAANKAERRIHELEPGTLVVELRHIDRDATVLPAAGVVVAARGYGMSVEDA